MTSASAHGRVQGEGLCLPIMLCWVLRCEETKFLCAVCMCFIQCCLLQEVLTEHVCAIGVQWGFNVVGGMTSLFPMEKSCLCVCFDVRPKCGNSILCFVMKVDDWEDEHSAALQRS